MCFYWGQSERLLLSFLSVDLEETAKSGLLIKCRKDTVFKKLIRKIFSLLFLIKENIICMFKIVYLNMKNLYFILRVFYSLFRKKLLFFTIFTQKLQSCTSMICIFGQFLRE